MSNELVLALVASGTSLVVAIVGLIASLINLLVWAGITYWFFAHFAELHVAA